MQDLKSFMQLKENAKFTGCIKFGVEHGRVRQLVELNATDIPVSRPCPNYDILLNKISERDFHGTLILEMRTGEVIGYAYSRTYANESLMRLIGNDLRDVRETY